MIVNILGSSSSGNAIVYHKHIMVDCGITYKKIKPIERDLKIVLLTHRHGDHMRVDTIMALVNARPTLIWGIPEHLVDDLERFGIKIPSKNIVILEIGKLYQFDDFVFSSFNLYHNVPNVGYRIIKKSTDYKIFHATDTYTLDGIVAKDYDLYAIEHNFDADTIDDVILDKVSKGNYSYEIDAVRNHLSFQKADAFYQSNRKQDSELVKLHISSRYFKDEQTNIE